ncbi:MAG: hypothetical protein VYA69_00730 [Gemmatimonadota bacterium]|nr:hypothetical protein [Gemmatimonadota bacterium]
MSADLPEMLGRVRAVLVEIESVTGRFNDGEATLPLLTSDD